MSFATLALVASHLTEVLDASMLLDFVTLVVVAPLTSTGTHCTDVHVAWVGVLS